MWRWALLAVAAADDDVKIELTEAGDSGGAMMRSFGG
jgi:hypothetical protein